ncbi:MAG TPA: N-formylglutamate deformylase [Planctomycetota bacterium]|nr:N-formylglutamate deformylase [Planctomycetota bacterium]
MTGDAPFLVRPPRAAEVPLLVSIPHTGTEVPDELRRRFADPAVAALPDTDWHLHELYDFVPDLGATTLFARFSRYVVDLNRPSTGARLYPGKAETELVPTRTFAGAPIYRAGDEPDADEVAARVARFWQPYHDALSAELERIRARFGYALLFDAHSIVGFVPRLHPTPLPDLMLGDVDGASCASAISAAVYEVQRRSGYHAERNFRFKGGHITRAYGAPAQRVHALQLEMSQRIYMDESPPSPIDPVRAARLRPVLRDTLLAFVGAAAEQGAT